MIFKNLKKIFALNMSKNMEEKMDLDMLRSNKRVVYIMSIAIFIFQTFNIIHVLFLTQSKISTLNNQIYFTLYVSLVVVALFMLILHKICEKKSDKKVEFLLNAEFMYAFLFCLWGVILNLYDLRHSENTGVYINILISVAVFIYLKPWQSVFLFGINHSVFLFFFSTFQSEQVNNLGNYINTTIIAIVALFISLARYVNKVEDFKNRRLLLIQNEQLESLNIKLKQQAVTDSLSNLSNRRFFDDKLPQCWNSCLKNSTSLAVMIMDIDNFKMYNDMYGHQAGDECIITVSQAIQSSICIEDGGIAFRYGGEEFTVILTNVTEEYTIAMAEKIRKNVENLKVDDIDDIDDTTSKHITLSIGVCWGIPDKYSNPSEFLGKADKALYMAKADGKNKVVHQIKHV